MNVILLYSHEKEPVTDSLLKKFKQAYPISLNNFLNNVSIFDEISDTGASVWWKLPDGKEVTNCENTFLINRVLSVNEELFDQFDEEDRSFALSELRAYLTFALSVFPKAFGRPSAFGLNENRYSLMRQWDIVRKQNLNVGTPEYFLGDLTHVKGNPKLVCSDPFDYYFWRPSQKVSSFGFIQPSGQSVVVFFVGKKILVHAINNEHSLSRNMTHLLEEYAIKLHNIFNYEIFEALFFVNHNEICFGMISPLPIFSSRKSGFVERIIEFFQDLTA